MTHRGPFQPRPFCDSVIPPDSELTKKQYKNVTCGSCSWLKTRMFQILLTHLHLVLRKPPAHAATASSGHGGTGTRRQVTAPRSPAHQEPRPLPASTRTAPSSPPQRLCTRLHDTRQASGG